MVVSMASVRGDAKGEAWGSGELKLKSDALSMLDRNPLPYSDWLMAWVFATEPVTRPVCC
jgi:hypothetical protein